MWTELAIVLGSCIMLVISYCMFLHWRAIWLYRHIPGVSQPFHLVPFRIPFFAPYIFQGNHKTMIWLSHVKFKHLPVYRITFFRDTFLVLNDMNVVKHVLLKNSSNYEKPNMYQALTMYGPNIVSIPGGDIHQKHRKIVEPAFQEKNLRELVEISNRSTESLLQRCQRANDILEVNKDMTDVTMDIIGKSAFGSDLNIFHPTGDDQAKHTLFDKKKHSMSFYDALDITNTLGVAEHALVPPFLRWLPIFNRVNKGIEEVASYLEEMIHERRSSGSDRSDLLSLLLECNENGELKLTRREVLSDAWIFSFAGFETTASALGHLLVELSRHPDIQDKVLEEIDRILPDRKQPTYDDLAELTYLNNCIKESLRLHAPAQAFPKQNKKPDTLGGVKIAKKSKIWIDIYSIHMSEENWKDPYKFNPDRFNEKYDPLAFLPFAYGARKCVGFNFSIVESLVIMSNILQNYRIEFEDGIELHSEYPREVTMVTTKVAKQNLRLIPRRQVQ